MNLTDYPTPRTEAAAYSDPTPGHEVVSLDDARQLEREAEAWKAVAEKYRKSLKHWDLAAANVAYDALKSQLEKP
jgi:hypothetical protein